MPDFKRFAAAHTKRSTDPDHRTSRPPNSPTTRPTSPIPDEPTPEHIADNAAPPTADSRPTPPPKLPEHTEAKEGRPGGTGAGIAGSTPPVRAVRAPSATCTPSATRRSINTDRRSPKRAARPRHSPHRPIPRTAHPGRRAATTPPLPLTPTRPQLTHPTPPRAAPVPLVPSHTASLTGSLDIVIQDSARQCRHAPPPRAHPTLPGPRLTVDANADGTAVSAHPLTPPPRSSPVSPSPPRPPRPAPHRRRRRHRSAEPHIDDRLRPGGPPAHGWASFGTLGRRSVGVNEVDLAAAATKPPAGWRPSS